MKLFVVLSAFVFSFAAFAADGTSTFRLSSGRILSFDYSSDLAQGQITGTLERDGVQSVQFSAARGTWSGTVGGTGVETAAIQTQEGGRKSVDISTIQGHFHYIFENNAKGDLLIRAVGPKSGELLQAEMSAKGAFSLATPDYSFELSRDNKHPEHFEGTVVTDYDEMDIDFAEMDATGALDPNAVAKADPALFIMLYVLPFQMGY